MEESIKELAEAVRRLSWGDLYNHGKGAAEEIISALVGGDPAHNTSITDSISAIADSINSIDSSIIEHGRDIRDGLFAVAQAIKSRENKS